MKKLIITLAMLLSFNTNAAPSYTCYSVATFPRALPQARLSILYYPDRQSATIGFDNNTAAYTPVSVASDITNVDMIHKQYTFGQLEASFPVAKPTIAMPVPFYTPASLRVVNGDFKVINKRTYVLSCMIFYAR